MLVLIVDGAVSSSTAANGRRRAPPLSGTGRGSALARRELRVFCPPTKPRFCVILVGTNRVLRPYFWAVSKRSSTYRCVAALGVMAGCVGVMWDARQSLQKRGGGRPPGRWPSIVDGDVRVVRAQTRETVPARSDTQLYTATSCRLRRWPRPALFIDRLDVTCARTVRHHCDNPVIRAEAHKRPCRRGRGQRTSAPAADGGTSNPSKSNDANRLASQTEPVSVCGRQFGGYSRRSGSVIRIREVARRHFAGGRVVALTSRAASRAGSGCSTCRAGRTADLERIPSGEGSAALAAPRTGARRHYRGKSPLRPFSSRPGK